MKTLDKIKNDKDFLKYLNEKLLKEEKKYNADEFDDTDLEFTQELIKIYKNEKTKSWGKDYLEAKLEKLYAHFSFLEKINRYGISEESTKKVYKNLGKKDEYKEYKEAIVVIEIEQTYLYIKLKGYADVDFYSQAYFFDTCHENWKTDYSVARENYDKYHNELEFFLREEFFCNDLQFHESDFNT
jgi:hypothetical protein